MGLLLFLAKLSLPFLSMMNEKRKKKNFFLRLFSFSGGVLFAFSSTMGWFISLLDGEVEFCALDSLLIIQSLKGFIKKNSEI